MASLYKKPIVKRDPKTGEKIKTKSKKWWGRYRDITDLERRVPLASDKASAQAMLNDLVRKVEREKAGLIDPADAQLTRPISEHLDDFERYLLSKGNTEIHCRQTTQNARTIIEACEFQRITDISASLVQVNIAALQKDGKGVSTRNHYLQSIKSFTRWLVRDRRTHEDRLSHLSKMNEETDRRHTRRALSEEEFSLLVSAARYGESIERIPGHDRVIMYVLAAWTGFRKGELGSMTRRSFQLSADPPTLTLEACYSKRKRKDTQVLHASLVEMVTEWLATKPNLADDDILFPVSAKVPGCIERKTSKMMQLDLAAARKQWIRDAETEEERQERIEAWQDCRPTSRWPGDPRDWEHNTQKPAQLTELGKKLLGVESWN